MRFRFLLFLILFFPAPAHAFDLNRDGYEDILVSSLSDGDNFNIDSHIYWGGPDLTFPRGTPLESHGGRGISATDLNADGFPEIIISNYSNGVERRIDSYIYWGDPENTFQKRTGLETVSGFGHSAADLNGDGYPDLVFSNYSDGENGAIDSYVYWGDASFEFRKRTGLATYGALSNVIADLNGDGYPDIFFACNSTERHSTPSYIYWGDEKASYSRRSEVATRHAYGSSVADLNRDGYPDIIVSEFSTEPSRIFWGSAEADYAFSLELETTYATANTAADLDQDGYPDILVSCYRDAKKNHQTDSLIYWGTPEAGYTEATRLATNGAHGNAAADLDGDGYPEIVIANSVSGTVSVFRGNPDRVYPKKTKITATGATGVCAGNNCAYGQAVP